MDERIQPSVIIKKMAEIGWVNRIRGTSLERNSLLYPINKVFDQIRKEDQNSDFELIKTSTIQLIYDYLDRIGIVGYKNRDSIRLSIIEFVESFFKNILGNYYKNKIQLVLANEKNLKASYLFYIRNLIPTKDNKEKGDQ